MMIEFKYNKLKYDLKITKNKIIDKNEQFW